MNFVLGAFLEETNMTSLLDFDGQQNITGKT